MVVVVWFMCHVEPELGGYTVAHSCHVGLPGIENPVVVATHVEQLTVLALAIGIYKLDAVVALVLIRRVG